VTGFRPAAILLIVRKILLICMVGFITDHQNLQKK